MAEYNFRIRHQPTLTLIHDDAIRFIKTTPKRYSLILNTVTSPIYFSSSKLYTEDFYEMVADRLHPDGVYTTWIDREIGDRGVDIILNTLENVFEQCWLTYIKSSYYLMVCSNDEIGLHQMESVQSNEILHDYLAIRHRLFGELIPYSILSVDAFRLIGQRTPINRLDHPVLEHEMARLHSATRLFRFTDRLVDRSNLREVRREIAPWFEWDPGGFLFWSDARLSEASLLRGAIDRIVEEQFGDLSENYTRVALELAGTAGTAAAYEAVGDRLYRRDLLEPAIEAYARALELDPTLQRSHYYLGRCHEKRGSFGPAELHFQEALRLDPDDEDAAEALERLRGEERAD